MPWFMYILLSLGAAIILVIVVDTVRISFDLQPKMFRSVAALICLPFVVLFLMSEIAIGLIWLAIRIIWEFPCWALNRHIPGPNPMECKRCMMDLTPKLRYAQKNQEPKAAS